jgi:2-methylcitrate dehydratase PrpD
LPAPLVGAVDRPPPFGSPLHALASAQYMLAVAARCGRCSPWEYRPELLDDPAITALARRVRLVAAEDLTAEFPANWGARLEVLTSGGTVRVERRRARGDPGHELSTPELVEKFVMLAGRSVGARGARALAGELSAPDPEAPATALTERVLPALLRLDPCEGA